MSIGSGVVLFVIGAIMSFALNFQTKFVDLHLIGYIFMGAGVVVFLIGLGLLLRKRQSVTSTNVSPDGRHQVTESSSSDI